MSASFSPASGRCFSSAGVISSGGISISSWYDARMKSLTKVEIAVACISFAGIFGVGIAGQILLAIGVSEAVVKSAVPVLMLLLFCLFGFACIGLMIHVF